MRCSRAGTPSCMRPECTLVDVLRARAVGEGERLALTFLADGERETLAWTYAELDRRARAVAAHLQSRLAPGERVVLAYPPGLDFVAAFFGCLYAGMIGVPVPALHPRRTAERMAAVAADRPGARRHRVLAIHLGFNRAPERREGHARQPAGQPRHDSGGGRKR